MNRQDLQNIAEAYSQMQEKKDSSYLETDMKKRQENNEKARKEMEKVKGQKNPHFEETNIRGNDSAEQKKRLEKKRGMKLDDHPQFKKEEVNGIAAAYQAVYSGEEVEDIEEADSLAAMAARREKRLKAQRKKMGTTAAGHDFGHDYSLTAAERKKRQDKEFDAFIGRGKKKTNEELELEGYKGKHGQSDKEYADSRSPGGKMVSGDSKMSGAEYTHGRRVKAANPGMQPDVGGKTKPKSQGKMDKGTRADMQYRKANLAKKEELELTGKFTAEEIEKILEIMGE